MRIAGVVPGEVDQDGPGRGGPGVAAGRPIGADEVAAQDPPSSAFAAFVAFPEPPLPRSFRQAIWIGS